MSFKKKKQTKQKKECVCKFFLIFQGGGGKDLSPHLQILAKADMVNSSFFPLFMNSSNILKFRLSYPNFSAYF